LSSNPAFSRNEVFRPGQVSRERLEQIYGAKGKATVDAKPGADSLEQTYEMPAATPGQTGRMTVEDTVIKSIIAFAVLLGGAAIGWNFASVPVMMVGLIGGLVLALVNTFRKTPSPALILTYALVEGLFVGAASFVYNAAFDGIVPQAVFGTLAVIGITLFLFLSGKFRSSARMTKIVTVAMIGYLIYQVVNMILMATGVTGDAAFGLGSINILGIGIPLGVLLGVVVVFLAAYSLVLDFESIKLGVDRGAPRVYGWQGAFGILVTVVWLYLEILRMLAIARSSD
jgi:uncharacterized YccA/Bax inhibitor family protein